MIGTWAFVIGLCLLGFLLLMLEPAVIPGSVVAGIVGLVGIVAGVSFARAATHAQHAATARHGRRRNHLHTQRDDRNDQRRAEEPMRGGARTYWRALLRRHNGR